MFTGHSAFPLTPLRDDTLDEVAFVGLLQRVEAARVDSVAVLGSTGSYAYLSADERHRVVELAAETCMNTPLIVGVSALRTSHAIDYAKHAERSGASGVLLAPMTYQPLTDDDVFALYRDVTEATSLPVIVYDNPGTTHVHFSLDLYSRIAELPGIASIKIPPGNEPHRDGLRDRIDRIRAVIPPHVTIGISGDARAVDGLLAGCDAWYSVLGGTLPSLAQRIADAARGPGAGWAIEETERLASLWALFAQHGSYRVVGEVARQLGIVHSNPHPLPIQPLGVDAQAAVTRMLRLTRLNEWLDTKGIS